VVYRSPDSRCWWCCSRVWQYWGHFGTMSCSESTAD